jgi:Tol biopolymer transport system component
MRLAPGSRLGPYEIAGLLGAGGMGEVYRVRDPRLGRDAAAKVLPREFSSDLDRLRRFEQEARAASALNHPGILTVFDVGTHEGLPYLVTELLEGETLRGALDERPLPLPRACDLAIQIARGLAAAHDKGIAHRDLKPENLFVTHDGRLKILDFGLARLRAREEAAEDLAAAPTEVQLTEAGITLGTVGYMSPEQVRGERAGPAADVFSFGAVFYEMLTGARAFRGDSPAETLSAILRDEPEPLAARRPEAPAALARLLERCLAKRPAERFSSGRELLFALEVASAVPRAGAAATSAPGPDNAVFRARRGWRSWTPWLAMGMAGAIAGAGAMTLVPRRSASPATPLVASIEAPEETFGLLGSLGGVDLAISPDGRQLIFAASALGREPALWIRALGSGAGGELPGTADGRTPFWSPDSRFVAFFAEGKLKRAPIDGTGPVQTLCDAAEAFGGFWHPDGTIVFADHPALYRVPASGGTPQPIVQPGQGEIGFRFPALLPDGRRFLFLARVSGGGQHRIYAGSLARQEAPQLVFENATRAIVAPGRRVLFVRDGVLLAQELDQRSLRLARDPVPVASRVANNPATGSASIAVSETGVLAFTAGSETRTELVWLDRQGKPLGVAGELNAYIGPTLSADGRRVTTEIADQETARHEIWMLEPERGVRARWTRPPRDGHFPALSPDGSHVAFSSTTSGNFRAYVQRADGLGEERALLLEEEGQQTVRGWTPDGGAVLTSVYATREGMWRLWLLPLRKGEKARPLVAAINGAISPDGRWLAAVSRESGRYQIYLLPYPALDARWQVSVDGGHEPRWRRDGRELFYLSSDRRLMSVRILASDPFDAAPPQALFPLRVVGSFENSPHHYDVAPDGERFLVSQVPEHAKTPAITVMVNWEAALGPPEDAAR